MRLIDADLFKSQFRADTVTGTTIHRMIDEQPTAYDVEKVVKKIKELPTHTFETYSQGYPMDEDFVDPCDVIKIVKSGGVADE